MTVSRLDMAKTRMQLDKAILELIEAERQILETKIEFGKREVWMQAQHALTVSNASDRWTFGDQVDYAKLNGHKMLKKRPRKMEMPVLPKDQ